MNKVLIKNLPVEERPRERLLKYGVEALSNEELLSIILRAGTKNIGVKELSNNILKSINTINDLSDITISKLKQIKGVGKVKAITLLASIELGKRVYCENDNLKNEVLDSSNKIYNYIKNKLINKKQEYFYAIYLDNKKRIIDYKLLFIGTLNMANVHPREIFRNAYLLSASSIICIHNHPSNDVMPSNEDIILTKKLVEIGKIQGINVIDHIIIGNNNYYSFYDNLDM